MNYEEIEDTQVAEKLRERQRHDIVKFKPGGCSLPRTYSEFYDNILKMEVREEDIWVAGFPRSGTTWTQEMVWLLGQDLDYSGAKTPIAIRFPYLEFDAITLFSLSNNGEPTETSFDKVVKLESPRYIKCHVPFNLYPTQIQTGEKRPKIIYVARNPKDACVSFYHLRTLVHGYKGTMDEFVEEFVSDLTIYAPFWAHIQGFWDRRHDPNVLFLTYETMKKDLLSVLRKITNFFGKSFTEAELEGLHAHLSFKSMKGNPNVNHDGVIKKISNLLGETGKTEFIRKGEVESWKEELSPESIQKLDKWIAKNKIPGIWEDI